MNLVALEGVILSERDAAIVISRNAGAAETLGPDALCVNPYDVSAQAEALHAALSLPPHERRERTKRMRAAATRLPPAAWFQAQLDALDASPAPSCSRAQPRLPVAAPEITTGRRSPGTVR
jgi:trehalose 6-phosphate synthase